MKKILFSCLFLIHSYGAVWSSSGDDGIRNSFDNLTNLVDQKNEESKRKWSEEIQPLIEKIKEQTLIKEQLIKEINALEIETTMENKNMIFLLEQEKKLLGNYENILGIQKESQENK
ncbi:hypothetical protein [Campylobacter sp. US33a]|uniref:hypothetical protein n=1 Tax=Campylobacter sp. US33a TaxID=2498120 RepID=UPI001067B65C|nr:hypothetical protein [Campylobacter sp. US33a]TEY00733.1 hypothetical protein ELQ16_08850 [Campylobacter sp. US33a]